MPLARTSIYAKGVDIWTAPTWDNDENWIANLRHIAREGRVYVIGVCTLLRGSDIPDGIPGRALWGGEDDWATPDGRRSSIPMGRCWPGR
jgi:nitrilase